MRIAIGLAGLALVAATACATPEVTVEDARTTGDENGIAVTGIGEVKGTPDTLTISLGVSVKRDTVDEAVNEGAVLADALITAIGDAGVAEEDIQTQNYSIRQDFRSEEGRQIPDGFVVDNTVRVSLRDIEGAGSVIDAATAAGGDAVRVQGVSFSLEDNDELLIEARKAAWADAQAKAEQLAELSGQELGTASQVAETLGGPEQFFGSEEYGRFESAADASLQSFQPGELSTTVQIDVRYELREPAADS